MFIIKGLLGGVFAGFICGLLGMGGGSVLVPLIFFLFNLSIKKAIGTSLMIIVFSSLSAFLMHAKGKQVAFRLALFIVIFGILGAQIGALFTSRLPEVVVKAVFILLVVSLGVKMWKGSSQDNCDENAWVNFTPWKVSLIGLSGGIVSGMCGVGGAILIVPLLHLIVNVPINICIGTALVPVFFNALSGSIGYLVRDLVEFRVGLLVAVGAVIAAPFGAKLSMKTQRKKLRKIFAVVLILGGLSILFKR